MSTVYMMKGLLKELLKQEYGSLTVEASLVCGIIIIILVNSMNISLIQYDKVISKENLITYCNEHNSINEKQIQTDINSRLFILKSYKAIISNDDDYVDVSVGLRSSNISSYVKRVFKECYKDVYIKSRGSKKARLLLTEYQ